MASKAGDGDGGAAASFRFDDLVLAAVGKALAAAGAALPPDRTSSIYEQRVCVNGAAR